MTARRIPVAIFLTAALSLAPAVRADTAAKPLQKYKPGVDAAVERALAWLAAHQKEEGSFPGKRGRTTAVVALGAMAFLSKGYTPGDARYGTVINRCIDYCLKHQRPNGSIDAAPGGGGMYAHCIATLLLSEVSGMVTEERQKGIDAALPKALQLILNAQRIPKHPNHKGGWRYKPNSRDSDISVSGWALMALRSARLNGAPVDDKAIKDARDYILRCQRPDGGFGYQPGHRSGVARTGVGLLCLELTGSHGSPKTEKAGDYVLRHIKARGFLHDRFFWYALYYCSQGMFQLGDEHWVPFAEAMYRHMLKQQSRAGYWKAGGDYAYPTAMTVLALGVAYRQLPIYQR
jgi:hypothetical protein